MKMRIDSLILIAPVALSCSPFYEQTLPNKGPYYFIAENVSADLVPPHAVLLARTESLDQCNSANINAELRGIFSPQSGRFEQEEIGPGNATSTLPCASLNALAPAALRVTLDERGYRPSFEIVASPRIPLYSGRSESPAVEIYHTLINTIYLFYNDRSIQVIIGSYGNRSGAEQEHTYTVVHVGDRSHAKTERLVLRKVRYDHLPEWW